MGFHVGLPCLKLSLNPSTQTHNGKKARTCSIGCAWKEMNDERRGRDKTIDHELTKDNIWISGSSDMDMEQVIQTEIDRINAERTEHGKRKMRSDAVSAIELIQKPPMDIMSSLPRDKQIELLKTSDEVIESIIHDWAPEWKTLATVIHFDEMGGKAPHPHKIFMPIAKDNDGVPVLNAKRDFNLKFFTYMNKEYPSRMRDRGYPVLDCEIYEDMTEQEREEHKEKKKDYGLEGYEYKQKKAAEQEARIKKNEWEIDNQKSILENQKNQISVNDGILIEQDNRITKAEQDLSSINDEVQQAKDNLKITNDKIADGKAKIDKQKEESKALDMKIYTKKQVKELPEPPRTFDGRHYKVPTVEYNSLRATAGQVDELKTKYEERNKSLNIKEKKLKERSDELDQREKDIDKKRRLPFAEKTELLTLRVLKKSIEWLAQQSFVPENIRNILNRALNKEDLTKIQSLDRPFIPRVRSRQERMER